MNIYSYAPHSFSIFGEIDITDLHMIMFRICESRDSRYSKHLIFLMATNEITFSHAL